MSEFNSVQLFPGVDWSIEDTLCTIFYKKTEHLIEFESTNKLKIFTSFLHSLKIGIISCDAVIKYGEKEFHEFVSMLDSIHYIREIPKNIKSGIDAAFEIEDKFYNEWQIDIGETPLIKEILEEKSQALSRGYAFEYYNVTRMAHDAICRAIPSFKGIQKRKILNFYLEEYRHDLLLLKALSALGYSNDIIESSLPLPSTQAYIDLLGYWARTDPLVFSASLFVYEGEVADYGADLDAYFEAGMPDDFIRYQKQHYNINVEGDHCGESREFLSGYEYVDTADMRRIIECIKILTAIQYYQQVEIKEYYSDPYIGIPRIISSKKNVELYSSRVKTLDSTIDFCLSNKKIEEKDLELIYIYSIDILSQYLASEKNDRRKHHKLSKNLTSIIKYRNRLDESEIISSTKNIFLIMLIIQVKEVISKDINIGLQLFKILLTTALSLAVASKSPIASRISSTLSAVSEFLEEDEVFKNGSFSERRSAIFKETLISYLKNVEVESIHSFGEYVLY